MKKIALIIVLTTFLNELYSQDLISGGSNSWIFHTPDDSRTYLTIAPKNNGAWDWANQTIFRNNGNVEISRIINIKTASHIDNESPGIVLFNNDDFLYDNQYINHFGFGFHDYKDNSSSVVGQNGYISGYFGIDLFTAGQNRFRVNHNGNVGIGTSAPDEKLTVKGKIHTQEIIVDLNGAIAPDYVFEKDYNLKSLKEVEAYIEENKHLPEIPSAKTMEEEGVYLKKMNLLLLKKIEELTLHTIEQQKILEKQNKRIIYLEKNINKK